MRRHLYAAAALLLAAGCAVGVAVGCGSRADEEGRGRVTELPQPGPELSKELMLGLSLAKNYHHKADVYLMEARVEQAVAAVRQILTIQFPPGSAEGEDIVHDARARLAKLLVTQGQLDEALVVVDKGIAGTTRESFFVANLHTTRGEVLEARAVQIEDRDKTAAATARREANASYDKAIAIEKALLEELAGGDE